MLFSDEDDTEDPLRCHPRKATLTHTKRKHAGLILPANRNDDMLALCVVVAVARIFVKIEAGVRQLGLGEVRLLNPE